MVVLAQGNEFDRLSLPPLNKPATAVADVPVVNLSGDRAAAASVAIAACEELGFFKITNHGIPAELMARLESESAKFFGMPRVEKAALIAGQSPPFGYGCRSIGSNGDAGCVEYLLLPAAAAAAAATGAASLSSLDAALEEYAAAARRVARQVLEILAEGLHVVGDTFDRLVAGKDSDCALRLNHYPSPSPAPAAQPGGGAVVGFGEHTDPQLLSLLRSNGTAGLEIALPDGRWATVPSADRSSLFVNVCDCLQVLTNGRFRSVKHRVVVGGDCGPRLSAIYFGGPPPGQVVGPLPELVGPGGRRLYREFTWREYKAAAYRTKLAANRLALFEL